MARDNRYILQHFSKKFKEKTVTEFASQQLLFSTFSKGSLSVTRLLLDSHAIGCAEPTDL